MTGESAPEISRKILPPHWLFFSCGMEFALDRGLPLARIVAAPWRHLGFVGVALGLGIILWAVLLFRRAKTGLVPFSPSTTLIVAGPYRFTRNPMYLGMTLILAGTALFLGSLTPWLMVVAFVLVIRALFISHEERMMESVHGEAYAQLKQRVRRWI